MRDYTRCSAFKKSRNERFDYLVKKAKETRFVIELETKEHRDVTIKQVNAYGYSTYVG